MKKYFLLIFLLLSLSSYSQIDIRKVKSKELTFALNNINKDYKFETEKHLIKFFMIKQRSRKSYFKYTDEQLNDLYIAISEFDETPKQQLFRINNIYDLNADKIKISDSLSLKIKFKISFLYKDSIVEKENFIELK